MLELNYKIFVYDEDGDWDTVATILQSAMREADTRGNDTTVKPHGQDSARWQVGENTVTFEVRKY